MVTIAEIRGALRLAPHAPAEFRPEPRHAAVALVLCPGPVELEACFIHRAERQGDPWSGQVAFPGGRASAGDPDAAAVAERETREEVGLALASGQRIGALPIHSIWRDHTPGGMTLSPFIYHVGAGAKATAHARIPHEVASVFWVPLSHLFDPAHCTELAYPPGSASRFSGIRYREHVIWGLTLRVLGTFAELLHRPLPALR